MGATCEGNGIKGILNVKTQLITLRYLLVELALKHFKSL